MTSRIETNNRRGDIIAPVLDWIPARYHRKIRAGTTDVDLSAELTAAVNGCGSYELRFEPGTYGVAAQITATNAARIRGRGATLKSLGSLAGNAGRGAILSFTDIAPKIYQLSFALGNFDGNAIFLSGSHQPLFDEIAVTGIKAGSAGMRAGATLYGKIVNSSFSGNGRSLDFQKGWEYRTYMTGAPTLTFANVGSADTITRNTGSWIADGFEDGDDVLVKFSASNNGLKTIVSRTATVITLGVADPLTNEGPVSGCTVNVVSNNYYGWHDGLVADSILSAREGARLAGYTVLDHTDHEFPLNQAALYNETPAFLPDGVTPRCAVIVMGEEIGTASTPEHYEFDHVYMELTEGSAGKLCALWAGEGPNSVGFDGGKYLGEGSGVTGSVFARNILWTGSGGGGSTEVNAWESGIIGGYTGNSGQDAVLDLTCFHFLNVTTVFVAGTGVQPGEQSGRNSPIYSDRIFTRAGGEFVGHNTRHGIVGVTIASGTGQIDMAGAEQYAIVHSGAATLTSADFANALPGLECTVQFADGNFTVSNSTIKLVCETDQKFAAGESLRVRVLSTGVLAEVGPRRRHAENQNLGFSAALATLTYETQTLTLTGAVVGDKPAWVVRQALPDGVVVQSVRVSAADTISVRMYNGSVGNVDLSALTWDISLLKG